MRKGGLVCLASWLTVGVSVWAGQVESELGVVFPVRTMTLPVGEPQMVAFSLDQPVSADQSFPVVVEPELRAEILRPPEVLAGHATGFVRVRLREPGPVKLRVAGAELTLLGRGNGLERRMEPPVVVSPVSGARVWGEFAVAVEWVCPLGEEGWGVELRARDGSSARPERALAHSMGYGRREVFVLDAEKWLEKTSEWRPVVVDAGGAVILEGSPVQLTRVEFGKPGDWADECEHHAEPSGQERFGSRGPPVNEDERASGGKAVALYSQRPVWSFTTVVEETGWYQLMVRGKAHEAAGTLPTIGIYVDESQQTVVNSRLAAVDWHRTPVGLPLRLDAGERRLVVQFRNDFARGQTVDRNLFLDRFELARVEAPERATTGFAVTLVNRLEGREVLGPLQLFARARWPGFEASAAPRLELWINGKRWAEQRGGEVRFDVPISAWRVGANRVEVRARSARFGEVRSGEETVWWRGTSGQVAGQMFCFGVMDEGWGASMQDRFEREEEDEPVKLAAFYMNGREELRLPESLRGRFRVVVEGRGREFEGLPKFTVLFRNGEGEVQVGEVALGGAKREGEAGLIELRGGLQVLAVEFRNDRYLEGKGDRNIWLERVNLVEETGVGPEGLVFELGYPRAGAEVGRQGLVLLRASGVERGDVADIVVGGRVVASVPMPVSGLGPWYAAFGDRNLSPGRTEFSAVLRRGDKILARTEAVPVTIRAEGSASSYDRAVHLLNRFAYGPEPALVAQVLAEGERAWLKRHLTAGEESARPAVRRRTATRLANRGRRSEAALDWVQETDNPVRARFVLWAQNHFSVWARKVGAAAKAQEHARFVQLGVGSFPELLRASATSPAMLYYLDQQGSFSGRLNENYARELLELHTVGVKAGYSQEDVTTLARVLTGWTLAEEADLAGDRHDLVRVFRFEPRLNSGREARVFGLRLEAADGSEPEVRLDRIRQILEMLALHPATAEFISRKLAEHYVGVPAPEGLVEDLRRIYLEQGGAMVPVLLALAEHPAFWASAESGRLASPMDFGVRMSRMMGGGRAPDLGGFLRRSGMALFDRSTPDGYPEACVSWADSNGLLQRWRWAGQFPVPNLPGDLENKPVAEWTGEDRQRALDAVAMRVNGRLLRENSNQALLRWLEGWQGTPRELAGSLGAMVIRLPETHVR